ncbi:MAG: hypothetical protein CfClM3_0222 [Methanobrevibacter sp. CfCl-M3]
MTTHCTNQEGLNFYIQYISGNDTEDLYHKSVTYFDYVNYWDEFAEGWKDKSLQEKVNALMTSASNDDVENIFNSASSDEIDYIQSRSEPHQLKLKSLTNDLSSKSTDWMVGHLDAVKDYGNKINESCQDLNEAIVRAHLEWNMKDNNAKTMSSLSSSNNIKTMGFDTLPFNDALAYANVLKAMDALYGIGRTGYDFDEAIAKPIEAGDLVQYVVNSSDKSSPMYKYLIINDVNNENSTYKVKSMFLTPLNMMGDVITEDKDDELHDVKKLGYEAWDDYDWLNKSDVDHWAAYTIYANNTWSLRDIFTIYGNTDPTGLEKRIDKVFSRPESSSKLRAIGQITFGSVTLAIGVGGVIAGIVVCCTVVGSPFGVPLILSGVALIFTGIGVIISGVSELKSYNYNEKTHKTQNTNIFNDIQKFNGAYTHV